MMSFVTSSLAEEKIIRPLGGAVWKSLRVNLVCVCVWVCFRWQGEAGRGGVFYFCTSIKYVLLRIADKKKKEKKKGRREKEREEEKKIRTKRYVNEKCINFQKHFFYSCEKKM